MPPVPQIVLVTGASRGAGQGIAIALGQKGCTVYITGRTQKTGEHPLPGTIYETAEKVTAAGGLGIPVPCDHADDAQVATLFAQIEREQGRLDILVNNAAAVHNELTDNGNFWEKPIHLADIISVGARSGYIAAWHASKLMSHNNQGLIAFTSASGSAHYALGPAYGAHKVGMDKMAHDMAVDFREANLNVAAISIWMGGLLTDRLKGVIASDPIKYQHLEKMCETPEFTGHLIWEIFNDPERAKLSGKTLIGAKQARLYGLQDAGGKTPPTSEELHGVSPIDFHPAIVR